MIMMMKQMVVGALVPLTVLLCASCSKDMDVAQPLPSQTWHVSIAVEKPADSATTRSLYFDDTALKACWTGSEVVKVYNSSGDEVGTLTPSANATGGTTTLTGDITGSYSIDDELTIWCPSNTPVYTGQTGTAESMLSKDYIKATVRVTAVAASSGSAGVLRTENAVFAHQQAFVKFSVTPAVSTLQIAATGLAAPLTVTAATDVNDFYVALHNAQASEYTLTGTTSGNVSYSGILTSKLLEDGRYYKATITLSPSLDLTTAINGWDDNGSVTVEMGGGLTLPDRTPPGVTLVDLGLPSGTLWASRNIGAISDTDYGLYFAWGDVIGRSGAVSSGTTAADGYSFSWTNTPYNYGSSSFAATKYNATDGLTQLEPCDDAAYMNWGGNWRMPTKEEFQELWGNTTKAVTYDYNNSGVAGIILTAANEQTLFLPVAGNRSSSNVEYLGRVLYYWSSSLYTEYGDGAYASFFGTTLSTSWPETHSGIPPIDDYNSYYNIKDAGRSYGFPVRPVQSSE